MIFQILHCHWPEPSFLLQGQLSSSLSLRHEPDHDERFEETETLAIAAVVQLQRAKNATKLCLTWDFWSRAVWTLEFIYSKSKNIISKIKAHLNHLWSFYVDLKHAGSRKKHYSINIMWSRMTKVHKNNIMPQFETRRHRTTI